MFTLTLIATDGTTTVVGTAYASEAEAEDAGVAIQRQRQPESIAFTVTPT